MKVWDLRRTHTLMKSQPRPQHVMEATVGGDRGIISLAAAPHSHLLFAHSLDHNIYAFHLAAPTPYPGKYAGHALSW